MMLFLADVYIIRKTHISARKYEDLHRNLFFIIYYLQGRIQGGLWGLSPPPGPVKSIDSRGFSGPNGCWAPPWKEKKFKPPPLDKFLNTPLIIYVYKVVIFVWVSVCLFVRSARESYGNVLSLVLRCGPTLIAKI